MHHGQNPTTLAPMKPLRALAQHAGKSYGVYSKNLRFNFKTLRLLPRLLASGAIEKEPEALPRWPRRPPFRKPPVPLTRPYEFIVVAMYDWEPHNWCCWRCCFHWCCWCNCCWRSCCPAPLQSLDRMHWCWHLRCSPVRPYLHEPEFINGVNSELFLFLKREALEYTFRRNL